MRDSLSRLSLIFLLNGVCSNGSKMNKPSFFCSAFLRSAGVLLVITALAKLISSAGHDRILQISDPIFGMAFRYVFLIVGSLELLIGLYSVFGKRPVFQTLSIAWLSTAFLVYRIGLIGIGYRKPCGCLGNLTGAIGLSPQMADDLMKGVLAFLLAGSYGLLIQQWSKKGKNASPSPLSHE